MLEIRTFRSERKGIRVDLYRKYRHADEKTGKSKFSYKQIGSFSLSEGYSSDIIELLQPDELIQLKNWLAEVKFAEYFHLEADGIEKFTIRMPKVFHDALIDLYIEAKRLAIDFIPHEVMLESLLHKAKLLQNKIDKMNGFKSGILEKIGIQSEKIDADESQLQVDDKEGQKLFKKLLDLKQSIGTTCTQLEEAAQKYGKIKRIPPPQLREWAGDMPNRNPLKRIKKWCYAIAIDVLLLNGINPIEIIPAEKVAEYWAIQRQNEFNLEDAHKDFIKNFNIPPEKKDVVKDVITNIYARLKNV